ncbi:hypothetical protein ACFLZX_01390 [Nanoarchaeota archaeon]
MKPKSISLLLMMLFTLSSCQAMCNNDVYDPGEECDGIDFNDATCQSRGFDDGPLLCDDNCMIDDSHCTKCGNGVCEDVCPACVPERACRIKCKVENCSADCRIIASCVDSDGNDPSTKGTVTITYHSGEVKKVTDQCRFAHSYNPHMVTEYICNDSAVGGFSQIEIDCRDTNPDSSCYGTETDEYGNLLPLGYCQEDNNKLFGICEPLVRSSGVDVEQAFRIEGELGVKRHREWINLCQVLSDPFTPMPYYKSLIDDIISNAELQGIEIMGMEDGNYCGWLSGSDNIYVLPDRGTPEYGQFLIKWEQSWETLAITFPKIKYWEVINEPIIMGIKYVPLDTKIKMFCDMLFYAKRGIKSGNPQAKVVMGGLFKTSKLRSIYECISKEGSFADCGTYSDSTDPDDYFDIAAWHPYLWNEGPTITNFVNPNIAIHNVMMEYGDEQKPVFITEYGFNDEYIGSQELIAQYLESTYSLTSEYLPFVETFFWFKLYEEVGASDPEKFGIIYGHTTENPFEWKTAAFKYQEMSQS